MYAEWSTAPSTIRCDLKLNLSNANTPNACSYGRGTCRQRQAAGTTAKSRPRVGVLRNLIVPPGGNELKLRFNSKSCAA
jgi:hypothetical protein